MRSHLNPTLLPYTTLYRSNRLVRQRNVVREGWSGIDVQLKRRTDLVPSLVETVKGYASHERSLFEEIASRRAARDRKSTRLNSSHSQISYGVCCIEKNIEN